jgi:AraC-like DNA-binding protein
MTDISPTYARFVVQAVLREGMDVERLFVGTSLDQERLETGGNISVSEFVAILNNGRQLTGSDALGLEIARRVRLPIFGAVSGAMAAAPTIREGLQTLENYIRLLVSYIGVELESSRSALTLRIHFLADLGEVAERFHAESSVAVVQHYVELITGERLSNARYLFAFPTPDYVDRYDEIYHSPVEFQQGGHAVELPHAVLDRRSAFFDAETWSAGQLQLADQLKRLHALGQQSYTTHTAGLLRSHVPPLPDLATVAANLHLSERTLNRRLQEEGTSFRHLRGQVLKSWAEHYLLQTEDSVEAIGASLGYSDAANFRRAFRSWSGCSPNEFRHRGLPT